MKNFDMLLLLVLLVLFIVFIMFYWNQDIRHNSGLLEELALAEVQVATKEDSPTKEDESSLVGDQLEDVQSISSNKKDGADDADFSSDLSVLTKTKEEAYDGLERRVRESKNKFLDAGFQFAQGKHQFSIPFFERFAKFDGDAKKDIVYASLGYDIEVIGKLETLVNKIDPNAPSYLSGLDKRIASDLLDILYNVTYYVREIVLNNHLNFFNLDKIKINDAVSSEDIIAIDVYLETLIQLRENLIPKLCLHISQAAAEPGKAAMEAELKKITDQNGKIRQAVGKMVVIAKTIEDLFNVQVQP
ncbi:hypothetical protein [Borrelia hermsii]|uniref:Uncharacterized protein n=2 Tax=Borrelia hermsii TaxID=140 RepID=T1ECA6_BORHE|nr:hypothetical protein [Borrelia hermsii]ADN26324.1 hypothetical protein BHA070 [Borrelia hermsii]AMR75904.1 hypothetical protein A0V01_04640 [Borrelia hermsii]ANA43710.1 hypothetical protein AXX13_A0330 [Borrelia hermsii HS1]UCP01935.1 hypothetical protein K9R62_04680 [Borrelia hermsii]UPA08503.1 hypothetical protein bhDAH_001211 [Borrelia hermsii DAH]